MTMKINVTDEDFDQEVIEKSHKIPVLVDFWAPWCGPCIMLSPELEKALDNNEFKEKVLLAKADTTNCQLKATEYGVQAIPNIQLFKNGKVIAKTIGFKPKELITEWLRTNLNR